MSTLSKVATAIKTQNVDFFPEILVLLQLFLSEQPIIS